MRRSIRSFGLLTLLAGLLLGSQVGAHSGDALNAEELVTEADFIFRGSVVRVDYAMSVATSADEISLPQTYVTFKVEQAFKGHRAGDEVTLVFHGGPVPNQPGRFLLVEGAPLFSVGDRDILFVKGNGQRSIPLVGREQGRFRLVGNRAFTNDGHEVVLTPQQGLARGQFAASGEMLTRHVGDVALQQVPSQRPDKATPERHAQGTPLDEKTLDDSIKAMVTSLHQASELAALPAVSSASLTTPLRVQAPRPLAAPAAGNESTGSQGTAEEEREKQLSRPAQRTPKR